MGYKGGWYPNFTEEPEVWGQACLTWYVLTWSLGFDARICWLQKPHSFCQNVVFKILAQMPVCELLSTAQLYQSEAPSANVHYTMADNVHSRKLQRMVSRWFIFNILSSQVLKDRGIQSTGNCVVFEIFLSHHQMEYRNLYSEWPHWDR